ncbi:hypothetical protein QN277_024358 [Acacia crassicarpa]|uniref:RING-type domain-containing protein n=1 Tax=Acacia crassicarpa TaxID=499986 RepID=A0AAE1JF26_9FABA|nr:hypothetical protein QN277_024358 [Acacia crassicarpa]
MDANWRPTRGIESTMDTNTSDWRTQLQPDSRERIINKIMDALQRHIPVSGQDGLHELCKIAQRFEDKIYTAATSQSDYLRKISLKILAMDNKTQNTMVNPSQSNAGGPSNKRIDSGIPMHCQVHNPGQLHATPVRNQNQQANNVQQPTQPMLQQESQSVIRQQQQQQNTSINNQQQIPISQQPILAPQQQQHLLALQSNVTSVRHPQLVGQQNEGDLQQHLRLLVGQQNNLPILQQPQQQQQQLINQQNNLANMHEQQLGSNIPGLQLQQKLATQPGNSSLQTNPFQPDMQQRLQASSSFLQQQNVLLDQQKQLYQSQRALPNSSSTSLDSTTQTRRPEEDDWKEELYQKIKSMKESYLPELSEMHQKIEAKLQQHEALPDGPRSDQLEKLKIFKTMLERLMTFLQISKGHIVPAFKEKMASYEKQILNFIETNRPRKAMSSMQRGQLPPPHMHPVPQSQSQLTQVQSHENQMNSQMQSTNFESFVNFLQQVGASSLQQNSLNAPQQQNVLDQQQQSYQSQRTLPVSSSCSTALTGKSGGDDWQEAAYQKKKNLRKSPEPPEEPVFNCPICMEPLVEEMSTRCGHIFCKRCIKAAINAQGKCPTCRKKVNVKELIRVFLPSAS